MQEGVGAAEDGRPRESGKHASRRKTLFRRLAVFMALQEAANAIDGNCFPS